MGNEIEGKVSDKKAPNTDDKVLLDSLLESLFLQRGKAKNTVQSYAM